MIQNDEPKESLKLDQPLLKATDMVSNASHKEVNPATLAVSPISPSYLKTIQPKTQGVETTPDVLANQIDITTTTEVKPFFPDTVMELSPISPKPPKTTELSLRL